MGNKNRILAAGALFLAVLIVALSMVGVINQYIQTVLMSIGINIIFAASLNIVNGYMGEFTSESTEEV